MKKHGSARLARSFSVLAAFAMAALLVTSGSSAYADDAATPDTSASTDTAAPATDDAASATEAAAPAEDPPPADDAAPAEDPAPAGDAAPAGASAATSDTSSEKSSGPVMTALKTIASADAAPADPDWIWQGSAPTLEDGEKDPTAYGGGSSEDTNPSGWSQASADTPKADLLKYYFNKDLSSGIVVSFGFTRASTNGDTAFAAEFNQAANSSNTPPRPVRTPGDYLLKFHVDSGNATLEFVHAFIWRAVGDFAQHEADNPGFSCEERYSSGFGWCEVDRNSGSFDTRVTDDGFTAEAKVNLSDLFPTTGCSPIFHSVNLRGESSAENWTNSLQDYLPLPGASVESTCASLVINKFRDGTTTKLAGAHFDVYEGPDTSGTKIFSDVTDGGPDDADSEVGQITLMDLDPGTYTVEETAPPGSDTADPNDDYFLDPDPYTITLTVAAKGIATFDFFDVKKWQPLSISKGAAGAFNARYLWNVEKQIAPTPDGPWSDGTTVVAPLAKTVALGGDTNLYYRLVVTETGVDRTDYVVSGTIEVGNPNDESVDATIHEDLATCTINGGEAGADADVSVPAGGASYPYSCALGDDLEVVPDTNSATVSWDKSTYPQAVDDIDASGDYSDAATSDPIVWDETATDQTITVTDDHYDFDPAWVIAAGDEEDGTYESGVYSFDTMWATQGACSPVVTNTATITGDEDAVLDTTSESGQVCIPAVIPPSPPEVLPPTLPNTGGPNGTLLAEGLWLVMLGGLLLLGSRRKRRS
jgi:LPXTG-motif cell wall-anchored protein